jgi:hypothetical protein
MWVSRNNNNNNNNSSSEGPTLRLWVMIAGAAAQLLSAKLIENGERRTENGERGFKPVP